MIETFIHEEYVSKRREQRRQQQQQQHQHQQRRRRQMRMLQIETEERKLKLPVSAAPDQQSPREQHQPGGAWKSRVGSPTADAASFRDHLFDYLKPY
ncbi:hypothetical protein HU200_043526 [Digitaria exilis]|uniref:Uncharacterized protein n=1 Tax=Digitaria exilis TaxID=1010633 RepID=A0A835B8Z1_9POAL|nr:hypothetical protein HU200_043526 [Digitaria exilis]